MGARFSLLPPCPLAPCPQEVVGTQIHTNLFIGIWEWGLVSWEWGEWGEWQERLGIEGSDLGVRGASFSLLPPCPLAPCPPEVVGTPIHTKLFIGIWEWAGSKLKQAGVSWEQAGASWSKLEQAGVSWEAGESWEQAGSELEQGEQARVSWSELGGWRELGASLEQAEARGASWSKLEQAGRLERAGSKLEQAGAS